MSITPPAALHTNLKISSRTGLGKRFLESAGYNEYSTEKHDGMMSLIVYDQFPKWA